MQSVAMSWLVYRLTGSEVLLGTVAFVSQIPMFGVSPFAGVITDRVDRRKLLIVTQVLALVQALVLAALVLLGRVEVWHVLFLSGFIGVVNAFDTPARQAMVPGLVERPEDLPNAIALNSTQFNIARLIGPAIAGLTIRAVGEGVCFAINAASFICVIAALSMMRLKAHERPEGPAKPMRDLREGAAYAWGLQPIRLLLGLIAVASLSSGVYQVLLPVLAKQRYEGDSGTLGYLYGAVGVGALVSAYMLARRDSVLGLGRWIVISSATFGVSLILLGLAPTVWTGLPVLAILGFGAMLHMGATNTLLQTFVEDRMRGRVMAFYTMAFIGTMPIGSLLSGALAQQLGTAVSLTIAGLITLFGSAYFCYSVPAFRQVLRPIYEERGILKPGG